MHFFDKSSSVPLITWIFIYAALWTAISTYFDPVVPYDAVEALNWGKNAQWGSPKNPWLVGVMMYPVIWFPTIISADFYWYFSHFIAIAIGLAGVWNLTYCVTKRRDLAWLAMLTLNLSGVINFDIIPYNDNYILVALWPWILCFFVQAVYQNPHWWLAFALSAGLATMGKYSTLALIAMVFLASLIVPKVRESYRYPSFYLAIVVYLAIIAPNFMWLYHTDFAAFRWVDSQITSGFNLHTTTAMISVFYPLIILAIIIYLKGGKLGWPTSQAANLLNMILLIPITIIYIWFSFNLGGRITEWLQPFVVIAVPLMVCSITKPITQSLNNIFKKLTILALIIMVGYSCVQGFNIRGAGQKFSGIKEFTQKVENYWNQQTNAPLVYVGGGYLHQWITFYGKQLPETIQPWIISPNTMPPNVYNRKVTRSEIEKAGALAIGNNDTSCEKEQFANVLDNWPTLHLQLRDKKEFIFIPQPGAKSSIVCVAIIYPKD